MFDNLKRQYIPKPTLRSPSEVDRPMTRITLLLPCLLLAIACSDSAPQAPANPDAAPVSNAQSQTPTAKPADDGLVPVTSRSGQGGNLASPGPQSDATVDHQIDAPGASFTLPATWTPQPPSSSMRLAQATLPGAAGDGQVTVFYFGPGGGGGVDSNLERWQGQMDPDPGSTASRESFDVNGFRVTWIESKGTLKPSTMGTGPTEPQPGSRLFGAVVEGPQGPWFFKVTGPAETLDAQRDAFLELLRSVRPRS